MNKALYRLGSAKINNNEIFICGGQNDEKSYDDC